MMIDYTFASALLSTKTASLLNKAQFRELRNTDDDGFLLKLQSFGYGLGDKSTTVEAIVASEILKLKEELLEIMPHDDLPSFFFSKFDLTNIRAFYKKKLFKASTGPYEEAGFLDEKVLSKAIFNDDYYALQEPYKQLISNTANRVFDSTQSLVTFLEQTFQALLHDFILMRNDPSLTKYFVISTDINNLMTLLRAEKLKLSTEQLKNSLLDFGSITPEEIAKLLNVSKREVVARYTTLYLTRFSEPLEAFYEDGDFTNLEHALIKFLLDELSNEAVDIKACATIIIYVIRKQIEVIDLRRLYLDRSCNLLVEAL
jgi:vacuolar-type H+-ATPase subunit C/Vma6